MANDSNHFRARVYRVSDAKAYGYDSRTAAAAFTGPSVRVMEHLGGRKALCSCEEYADNTSCGHIWVASIVQEALRRLGPAWNPIFSLYFPEI